MSELVERTGDTVRYSAPWAAMELTAEPVRSFEDFYRAEWAGLPLDQRSVVVLRYYLDWSTEEMAEAMGVAPGTVKSRLHRALRRLERALAVPA